jgi:hypothetical protein
MRVLGLVSFTTVPGTPSTTSGLNVTGLRRIAWEKKLRQDSVKPSVFSELKSAIKVVGNNVIQTMKGGIFMEVDKSAPDQGQSCRLAMQKPLTEAPQLGNSNDPLGNEDESTLVYTTLHYNEIKKAIKYRKWGYDYNDTKYLNWLETNHQQLSRFLAEYRDTRIHTAMTLTHAPELWEAPVSKTPLFNKNWIIPNLDESSYPSWDNTSMTQTDGSQDSDNYYSSRTWSGATTFVENICASLLSASGTGSTSKATLKIDFLQQLIKYATDDLIMSPVMLDGKETYVFLVPANAYAWMLNPNNSGSLGEFWENFGDYSKGDRNPLTGELGRFGDCLLLVKNMKAPTLTVDGSAGSYTIQMGWQLPGNNDDRNKSAWSNTSGSTNYVFDMGYLLGENALAEYVVDEPNMDLYESTQYGKIQGNLAYTGAGIQIPAFDLDSSAQNDGSSTTQIQRNCACVPISRAPVQTVV